MNHFFKLSSIVLASFTTSAWAADQLVPETKKEEAYHDSWSVGIGLGLSTEAERWQFTAKTPVLFSFANQWGAADYSMFAEAGGLSIPNIVVDKNQRLKDADSWLMVFGLESRKQTLATGSWSYMQLGLVYLNGNEDLWKTKNQLGGKFGFGFEVGINALPTNAETSKNYGVFFAEYNLLFGLERADKLPGQPDLANGSSILVGSRSYF